VLVRVFENNGGFYIILVVRVDVSSAVFEILTHKARTCLTLALGVIPTDFLDETYPAKIIGMGLCSIVEIAQS